MENREIKFRAWDKILEEQSPKGYQLNWLEQSLVMRQVAGSSPVCPAGNLK